MSMTKPTIAEIDTRLKAVEETVAYNNKVLIRGNGTPSLVEEVHSVVAFMNDQKESYKYWSRLLLGGMIVNIMGFVVAALVWFIRILPVLQRIEQLPFK